MQSSAASCQKPETETPEEETVSLGSSTSGGSSLPDQGYAASEGMVEGEDSGAVSSPSDTQPTSPDGSLSLDGSGRGERPLGPVRDNSSDSDEGCATWGSRHRHNDVSPQAKSGRLKDSYEDDPELTAQLHQTLADFEAHLADHIDVVSSRDTAYTRSTDSNEVPVSVVDMDVPVTAIDEVLEDYECHTVENETTSLTRIEPAGRKGPGFCHQSSAEPQNQNNNACTAAGSNKSSGASAEQPSRPEQHRKSAADKKEKKMLGAKMKETSAANANSAKERRTTPAVKPNVDLRKHSEGAEIKPDAGKSAAPSFQEKKSVLPPASQRSVSAERDEEAHGAYQNNSSPTHGKITRNVISRFGMNTFTVVPPKPAVMHAAAGEPAVKVTVGAIKIDDQGNMVKGGVSRSRGGGSSEAGVKASEGSPLLGKAKAFWSSTERQESSAPHSKDLIDKAKESADGLKSTPTAITVTALKSSEDLKVRQNSFYKHTERAQPKEAVREGAKEPVRAVTAAKEERVEVESKISVSKNVQQPSHKPALPPPFLPDLKKDLSFLKPSRRTSSQYVASAITKYTPKHQIHPSAKPSSTPNVHDSSASLKSQAVGFQRSGRSITVNPQQSSLSDNKENDLASKSNPPYPQRSMSFPECVSDIQSNFGGVRSDRGMFGSCVGSAKGSFNTLETETALNKHVRSGGPAQRYTIGGNDGTDVKQTRLRSPSPAQSSPLHSSARPPPETVSQGRTSDASDATKAAAAHLMRDAKPSAAASDKGATPGPPPPVTLFGPIQKFRPVISRCVEKDSTLHGSLMEAIQTGGGRDRLKKITTSGLSSMKKSSHVEEESERSALLAAIRAQSSSGRLRKTTCEAAEELVKFRKVPSERAAGPPPSHSPAVFTPPPPPPPPPPALPQGKPSTVAHPGANTAANPAMAREAMLEAIRSGSASERLKKVAAPTKTVQVNGRLGTIQATSSTLPRQ